MEFWIGFIASICISISILPQISKMWKLRHEDLKEFHILWFAFNIIGSLLFMWYGYLIEQIGLIILNVIGTISSILMFLIYLGLWKRKINGWPVHPFLEKFNKGE
jgi:uncharacterized protein with PQ loop repeat